VRHTVGGSGVLLYISLFERMGAVIADQGVVEKLGQPKIDELCRQFTERLRSDSPIEAVCETARCAGRELAAVMPRAEGDVNELSDALIVID
jgi:putative membrane protein